MDETLVAFVEHAIREFLAERPDCSDTAEGIHRWWIRWPALPESQVITEIALERLEAEGVVEHFRVGDRVVWRRRRETAPDADQAN